VASHGYGGSVHYLASYRTVFKVTPYLNPDYLGPRRFVSLSGSTEAVLDLPAFRRLRLRDPLDLFQPEGYAILPGLQAAWLGSVRGPRRHFLNNIFISSWKDVLSLSSGTERGIKYTTDWWLPTALGGLGLENTDPSRSVDSSSLASRKLAFWLYHHQDRVPLAMPSLAFRPDLTHMVLDTLSELPAKMVRDESEALRLSLPLHADVLNVVERKVWMSTFQVEADLDGDHAYIRTGLPEKRGELLAHLLLKFRQSRARFWLRRADWWKGPPINQEMLAAFSPGVKCYDVELPTTPQIELCPSDLPSLLPHLPVTVPAESLVVDYPEGGCLGQISIGRLQNEIQRLAGELRSHPPSGPVVIVPDIRDE